MAFDKTVPDPDNFGLDDISAMQENFSLLESAQVVDEGSTSDGDYIRFENGWQICIKEEVTLTYDSSNSLIYDWDYPVSFSEKPTALGNIIDSTGGLDNEARTNSLFRMDTRGTPTESVKLTLFNDNDPFTEDYEAYAAGLAIGRWK